MLPPFHIRNLQPTRLPNVPQDTLVRISAPWYDETISSHPAATLKYHDEEDGDLITLGSSRELTQKLEEPVLSPSSGAPVTSQHGAKPSENHVFEIDDRDYVRKLWQDIRDSENVSIAHDQDHATNWNAEKKNCLAVFYERQKHKIWSPIAQELGVTWQSVEAMHWSLGRDEIARRALELGHSLEQSGSSKEITETKLQYTYNTATQQFEEYRVHHFNATRPPQIPTRGSVTPQPFKATKVSAVDLICSASSIMNNNKAADAPVEGKRQAQAAGDKLRSRMTAVESHQNRWASYKSSASAFPSKPSTSLSLAFDGPGLTSEGKRQAQVAGDKLRCRTNPIRHSRPSRVVALENGISKNRWSSYSGTRAARFDERQDAQDVASITSKTVDKGEVPRNDQPSLLEVFEAELAKKPSDTDSDEAPGCESSGVQSLVPKLAMQVDPSSESQGWPLPQRPQALLRLINERLQELTAGDTALSQDISTAIDHGIRTAGAAVSGLSACIQGLARGLQEVSTVSRQAADRTRNANLQLIDDALLRFQSRTRGFTAASGRETAANWPAFPLVLRSQAEEVDDSSFTSLGISHHRGHKEDATAARKSSQTHLNGSDDPSQLAYSPKPIHAAAPMRIFEKPASPQLETESKHRSEPGMSKESTSHKPASVPLPNCPGYVNHLRRSQSIGILDEQHNFQRTDSPPFDSPFPASTQFRGESFGPASTFPPLPSMKPLVPQRAPSRYMYGSNAGEPGSANGNLPFASNSSRAETSSRSDNPVAGHHEHSTQRDGHAAIPLSRLSSAARLAGPFDPLEAEPSAQPHLTEGLRRNATIACTDIRNTKRCARPYSDVFDGLGRVPWATFLQGRERRSLQRGSHDRSGHLGTDKEDPQRHLRLEADSRRSPLAAAFYDDQHHDDSTVGKINDCVERLRDLGFGGEDNDSAGRLLIYAQAADGVLVDAIDLIDEEQRAWQRL